MDGYCVRLANILHHLRFAYADDEVLKCCSADAVDVVSIRGAIELIDYFKNHARRALGRMHSGREGNLIARLIALVLNSPNYRVRPRSLLGARLAPNVEEAKALLTKLVGLGLGTFIEGERKDTVIFQ
jgi:hypothetical protein